ncbi:MAG: ATP-binding cassette, subfamily putative efflux pump [Abditibacteriota bacterium]|nr:ATP-binding cassette, subfamily putative efflux pump [Abditibacteriota bacterium]
MASSPTLPASASQSTLSHVGSAPPQRALRRFLGYVKPYAGLIWLATFCGIFKLCVPATMAVAQSYVIDELVTREGSPPRTDASYRWSVAFIDWTTSHLPAAWNAHTPWGQLNVMMVTLTIIYALWGLSQFGRMYLSQLAGHRVILDLRTDLYQHITRMSHSFFQTHQSGGIVSRLMSDIALAQNFVGSAMSTIWMDLSICIFFIALMFSMDTPLTWASLAVFPLYILSMKKYGRAAKQTTKAVQEALEDFSGDIQERVAGINVVKSFAAEGRESRSFFHGARDLYNLTMRAARVTAINSALTQWLTQMATMAILWYGGYRLLTGQTTLGTLISFLILVRELYMPMNRISEMNTVLNNSLAAIDRVFEVFDIAPDVQQKPNAQRLSRIKGRITFEKVTFVYEAERPVLRDINLDIRPGEVVALVGSSGAGKSTLVQMVPRFYDPQNGRVLIDDTDVRDVTLRSLRSQIGVVAQETLLFSGTVRENLLYGKPDASEDEMTNAARAAHAHDFITALPDGYDSLLGERGAKLSGGQKQRIAIARAFLSDPRILILDEATSALDSESEALIQEALAELMKGRTNIVIAHRLSTILGADRIAVMRDGQIVDCAQHEVLLGRCKLYANLYNTQFRVALKSVMVS